MKATNVKVYWDETSDYGNPGWVCSFRLADGQLMTEPLDNPLNAHTCELIEAAGAAIAYNGHIVQGSQIKIIRPPSES